MKKVTALLLGAGNRGTIYADQVLARPLEVELVGVAEPDQERRERIQKSHGRAKAWKSWEEALGGPKRADCAIISTQDTMHFGPAMEAMSKGYHVLLEKPMSGSLRECLALEEASRKHGRLLLIAHVLRYSDFFRSVHRLVQQGVIGKLISIQLVENVGYWHFAHSFVRGHWRNSKQSNPIILAKSCHDMDIMAWLADSDAQKIASFGKLNFFTRANRPEGATARCLDGCPHVDSCLYSVKKLYAAPRTQELAGILRQGQGEDRLWRELRESQFGDCVFTADNDVVDNQVTAIEFANGVTATFTLNAFSNECTRTIRLVGTEGELSGDTLSNTLTSLRFDADRVVPVDLSTPLSGHGGGDGGLIRDFVEHVAEGRTEGASSARLSLMSHVMAFAAEESRTSGTIVDIDAFLNKNRGNG
jgi:predicted dehydrogenase